MRLHAESWCVGHGAAARPGGDVAAHWVGGKEKGHASFDLIRRL
jgi:hypothetical protein